MKHHRRQALVKLLLTTGIFLLFSSFWFTYQQQGTVQIAVAKGQQLFDMELTPDRSLNADEVNAVALADARFTNLLPEETAVFVNAIPLSRGEARPWQAQGCGQQNCAHAIYYGGAGGTVNAIVNLDSEQVIARWTDDGARPGGSAHVVDEAVAIAAADAQVTAVLGNIGDVDPAMVPMSAWLMDGDCRDEWCLDLTFLDPNGTGRIFHIFVNMAQQEVARTFYTRGRPDLDVAMPVAQRNAFSDGCHEQYGWNVCWEMTGHDGINFRDAAYQSTEIFSSIKIPQIEAWYPSWPGGYRDEIGFAASVPPFGDTQINDLGDSFEVRQLFTEFTSWPNCICCYRYEQIIRFYADGAFEPRFVSHGPGCDDLSVYRPFWRMDIDLDGPDNDEVWVWQESQWTEAASEQELFPFVENLSPESHKLASFDGETHYRWRMLPTDPLGLDEAYFFLLQDNEMEGEGPLSPGPGDTYQPPRQWIDGDPVSGENVVFWYVPLLKTKKTEPLWCMPDPEPGINQCEAILQAAPGGVLHQPTADELTAVPTPTDTATPAPTVTPAPTATPRPVQGNTVEEIILNAGCGVCHAIGEMGEGHKVGPDLSNIGAEAGDRIERVTAAQYLRQSILNPNAFIAPECPNSECLPNIMPQDYGERLTETQINRIVDYLLEQTAEAAAPLPEVGADTPPSGPTPLAKAAPATKGQTSTIATTTDVTNLSIQLLLVCIVFFLTLFMVMKRPFEEEE